MSGVSIPEEEPPSSAPPAAVDKQQAEQEASTSGRSETEAAAKTPCAFYMRTGTCAYVSPQATPVLLTPCTTVPSNSGERYLITAICMHGTECDTGLQLPMPQGSFLAFANDC